MKRLTALTGMNEDNSSTQFSISSGDVQRMNRELYDKLNNLSKEDLILMIMGDELYYNR
jgi:hypothetical protein